jgi:hypothetical protein
MPEIVWKVQLLRLGKKDELTYRRTSTSRSKKPNVSELDTYTSDFSNVLPTSRCTSLTLLWKSRPSVVVKMRMEMRSRESLEMMKWPEVSLSEGTRICVLEARRRT